MPNGQKDDPGKKRRSGRRPAHSTCNSNCQVVAQHKNIFSLDTPEKDASSDGRFGSESIRQICSAEWGLLAPILRRDSSKISRVNQNFRVRKTFDPAITTRAIPDSFANGQIRFFFYREKNTSRGNFLLCLPTSKPAYQN